MKLADASAEQIKLIEDLLKETKEMWQRIRGLEQSLENCQATVDFQKIAISRYRMAFKHLPCGVYAKDADTKYLFCNDAYASMINRRPEDFPGKTDRELFSQDIAVKLSAEEKQVWHSGRVIESEEKHLVMGEDRTFLVARKLFRGDEGDAPHLLGIMVDITERKRLEERLEQLFLACSLQNESLMSEVEQAKAAAKQQEVDHRALRTDLEKRNAMHDAELVRVRKEYQRLSNEHNRIAHILLSKVSDLQHYAASVQDYLSSLGEDHQKGYINT